MNHTRAAQLPLLPLTQQAWFRSVQERFQYEPPLVGDAASRFNSGQLQVMYFAPDPLLARFEARDLLGHWFGDAVPAPQRPRDIVVEYHIDIGGEPAIADARPPQLAMIETTVQEMTGDWSTYPWETCNAPTQDLALAVFDRHDAPTGLTAPSARNPRQANLILFPERLPSRRSISLASVRPWHESRLLGRTVAPDNERTRR